MGLGTGRTRRSKQLPKSSSTILCDFSGAFEDCKQKTKVKDSAPVNQQRFAFTSQRLIDKSIVLANFSSIRQWQIVIDSPIEEIRKDLSSWCAAFHSKTISGQFIFPTVLKEGDYTSSCLYSRTAEDLRRCRVSCDVFFLFFNKWIPNSQLEKSTDLETARRRATDIDFKIDEKFQQDSFLIDISGNLNGVHISMPFSYVMNGRELVTKLLIVEQTAQYREKHKLRYQGHFASSFKYPGNCRVSQDSPETECPFYSQDYGLHFDKTCEFTAFISQDQHQLRCIVIPLVIIPVHGEISLKKQGLAQISRCSFKNMIREFSSGTSHTEANLSSAPEKFATDEVSVVSKSKKKKKRKSRKHSKVDAKNLQLGNSFSDTDRKRDADINSPLASAKNEVLESDGLKFEHCSKIQVGYNSESDIENECSVVAKNPDHCQIKLKSTVEFNSGTFVPDIHLKNMDVELHDPLFSSSSNSLDASHAGCVNSNEVLLHIENERHHHTEKRREAYKEFVPESENCGHQLAALVAGESEFGSQREGNVLDSVACNSNSDLTRKTKSEVGLSSSEECPHNSDSSQNKHKVVPDTFPKVDPVKHKPEPQFERKDQFSNHVRTSRDGFWTRRAAGAESNNRNRAYQSSFNVGMAGESRSSLPFWRHQRVDPQRTSQPWSKLSLSQREEWSLDRGGMPYSQQLRSTTRPFMDLKRGWGGSHRWEGSVEDKTPLSQEQKTLSNGQSRRTDNNYEVSSQSIRKWLSEDVSNVSSTAKTCQTSNLEDLQRKRLVANDLSHLNADSNSVTPDQIIPNVKDATNSAASVPISGTNSQEKNAENLFQETEIPNGCVSEPQLVLTRSYDATKKCNGDHDSESACGLQGCQLLKKQMMDHVCNIVDVVQASYHSAFVYQQVSGTTGSPLCEYDKFAKAVTPVLRLPECTLQYNKFVEQTRMDDMADLTLCSLWDWYEEPSCFGLEVKLTDFKKVSTKMNVNSEFHAYFVPFLSAIQLFGCPRRTTNSKDADVDENSADWYHCSVLSKPIFSVLTPNSTSKENDGVTTKTSKLGSITNNLRHCGCVELLYEFFEGESPPQRRPLSEKIKQLVMGRVAPESSSDGDACALTSVKIGELHPSSWFAVAWYPIYRIPDGNFRSTFLTYHSLSSLQLPAANNGYHCCGSGTLTVPVVGLMSYNVQAKDWFAIKSPHSTDGDRSLSIDANPAQLLQEHLTKLDAAAACMARGFSNKLSGFKHLDYNFFQNRGR